MYQALGIYFNKTHSGLAPWDILSKQEKTT